METPPPRCVILGCTSEVAYPKLKVGFFQLPKDSSCRRRWIKFIEKNQNWSEIFASNTRICSQHFQPDSFYNLHQFRMGYAKLLKLVKGAVPSIYPSMVADSGHNVKTSSSCSAMLFNSQAKTAKDTYTENHCVSDLLASIGKLQKRKLVVVYDHTRTAKVGRSNEPLDEETPSLGHSEQSNERPQMLDETILNGSPIILSYDGKPLIVKKESDWNEEAEKKLGNTDKGGSLSVCCNRNESTSITKEETNPNLDHKKTVTEDEYNKKMAQSMYAMQKSETFCDFTILVENEDTKAHFPVPVHRLVFSCASSSVVYKEELLLDVSQHMNRSDASSIIEFVYTGKIAEINTFSHEKINKLMSAAELLQIPDCVLYLKEHAGLDSSVSTSHERDSHLERHCMTQYLVSPASKNSGSLYEKDRHFKLVSHTSDSTTDTSGDEAP